MAVGHLVQRMSARGNAGSSDPTASVQLVRRIQGLMQTQLIFVASHLAVADRLKDGGKSIAELAAVTGTIESRLYRIMRALSSIGLFVESAPRYFELTPLAKPLQSDASDSVRDLALMVGSEWHVCSWANILHSLHGHQSAFEDVYGVDLYTYLDRDSEAAGVFDNAMTYTARRQADAICAAYDFSGAGVIVDVGGGRGFLLSAILNAHPNLRAVLLERNTVVDSARRLMRLQGVEERCKCVAGDFLSAVPAGGDLYLLKHVVHNWSDDDASRILSNCRAAMNPAGRLLVIDDVMPLKTPAFEKTSADIEMMVLLDDARERTQEEFGELFLRSGFTLSAVTPTRSGLTVLQGIVAT